jgi:hypothetical protein
VLLLCSSCASCVPILCSSCASCVPILYSSCAPILCSSCTPPPVTGQEVHLQARVQDGPGEGVLRCCRCTLHLGPRHRNVRCGGEGGGPEACQGSCGRPRYQCLHHKYPTPRTHALTHTHAHTHRTPVVPLLVAGVTFNAHLCLRVFEGVCGWVCVCGGGGGC